MAELISGPTMVLQWVAAVGTAATGTTNLTAAHRKVTWSPKVAYEDVSAGQDSQVGRLPTLKDATASVDMVQQTSGTALIAATTPGQAGTLIIGPEGTATGMRKITFPAYCDGAVSDHPYANVSTFACGFTGSSALNNYTDATY